MTLYQKSSIQKFISNNGTLDLRWETNNRKM